MALQREVSHMPPLTTVAARSFTQAASFVDNLFNNGGAAVAALAVFSRWFVGVM